MELLAHEDLLVSVSPCPMGDQRDTTSYENFTCYPVRVAIYESDDGPFETAPDPQRKTMNAVDFVKAGRPGMATANVGTADQREAGARYSVPDRLFGDIGSAIPQRHIGDGSAARLCWAVM